MLKAFYCDSEETELYAAENAKHAAQLEFEITGDELSDGYPRELTDAELDAPIPAFDQDERKTGQMTTIRQLLADHGQEPGWFAGSNQ